MSHTETRDTILHRAQDSSGSAEWHRAQARAWKHRAELDEADAAISPRSKHSRRAAAQAAECRAQEEAHDAAARQAGK